MMLLFDAAVLHSNGLDPQQCCSYPSLLFFAEVLYSLLSCTLFWMISLSKPDMPLTYVNTFSFETEDACSMFALFV